MSVHYATAPRAPRHAPLLPRPSLVDVLGHLALVVRYAAAIRKARR